MKMKGIRIAAFWLIFAALFMMIQNVLQTDHEVNGHVYYILHGFDHLEEDSIEVLLLGASHGELGMSPMKLYEDTGICAYSLSTGAQPIQVSYYLLNRALRKQNPSVVFYDPESLFGGRTTNMSLGWRLVIDNLPLDRDKIAMAIDSGKMKGGDGVLSTLLPIIKYHTRWSELTQVDFQRRDAGNYYSAGQFIVGHTSGVTATREDMDSIAKAMTARNEADIKSYSNNEIRYNHIDNPLWAPKITEENVEYLTKMKEACEQDGATLILLAYPTLQFPMSAPGAWTEDKHLAVKELADELGLTFVDMLYDVDTGVDFTTDTYDGGAHLNLLGSEKTTAVVEEFLEESFSLTPNRNEVWDAMLEKFRKIREVAYLQSESDFHTYLSKLLDREADCSILIAASTEYISGLREEDFQLFDQLGLQLIREGEFADSYLAVIQGGTLEYEAVSPRRITYRTKIDGAPVFVASAGWYNAASASVQIDGKEYARNQAGLNIVVWDKESGLVIDSVSINTRYEDQPVVHAFVYPYLREYESVVCIDGVGA